VLIQHSCVLHPLLKQNGSSYFGALVAKGRFVLDGKAYHLYINDGKNALHGELSRSRRSGRSHEVLPVIVLTSASLFIRWPQGFQQGHLDGEGVRA